MSGIKNRWIDWVQLILLGITAPLFLFPSVKFVWIFLIFPVLWVVRRIVRGRFFQKTILDWAYALLFVQVAATCFIVSDLQFSLPKITGVLFGFIFFYACIAVLTREDLLKWGCLSYLGAGLIISVVGLLGINWDYDSLIFSLTRFLGINFDKTIFTRKVIPALESGIPRIKWDLPGAEGGFNANAIGGVIILLIPLSFLLWSSYWKRKNSSRIQESQIFSIIFFFVFLFLCGVLLLTLSIGSWIALLLGVWMVLFPKKWKGITLVTVLMMVVALLIFFRSSMMKAVDEIRVDLDKEKVEFRLTWWSVGVETIRQNPVFGVGMNRMRLHPAVGYRTAHVHNHFLNLAAELGIPGLLAYLAILFGAAFMCFRLWRESDVSWIRTAALGLGCGQLAHFVFGIIDSIPLGAKVGILFWFSLALIAALYNHMLQSKSENSSK